MIPPLVAVADGTDVVVDGTGVCVGKLVGTIGVGGAAMDASVSGMHAAEVTLPAIHANPPLPPANSIYHQVPSKFLPATVAVPPCGMEPIVAYTCPGPLRTFTTVFVVTVGLQASTGTVAVGLGVSEGMGVNVSVLSTVTASVGGAPPGRLQASTARVMKTTENKIFLFFASIKFSSGKLILTL